MSEVLRLPYFTQDEHSIRYLGQYPYLELDGLDLDSPNSERFLLSEGIYVRKPSFLTSQETTGITVGLEPHPDDTALSSSGYVMSSLEAGEACEIVNLFSRTAIERFPWQGKVIITEEQFEALRLQESRIAVKEFLGQRFTSLRLPLASKRGYREIFADKHEDQGLVRRVGETLVNTIVELDAKTVLSPLAVQGHIDHLVTFDVGMFIKRALGHRIELLLYEDYPYTRNKEAYSRRLQTVMAECQLQEEYVAVDAYLDRMADMAIIYRSQFDDINRDQMHALMREDLRATALEGRARGFSLEAECAQRYWRVYES